MTVDGLRARLTDEYGEERFTMTVSEIEQRSGRGSRRRLGAWAAVAATAAVAAAGWLVWPQPPTGRAEPLTTPTAVPSAPAAPSASVLPGAWAAGFAEECERKWQERDRSELRPEDRAQLPPLLSHQYADDSGIRLYGTEWLVVECEHTDGQTTLDLTHAAEADRKLFPDPGTDITYYATSRSIGSGTEGEQGPDLIVGRAPAGAVQVEAVTPDGRVFPAQPGGHLFLVWAPRGGLRDAVLRADVNVSQVLSAAATSLPGAYDQRTMDAACRENLATKFAPAGPIAMPPRRFIHRVRVGERALFFYASPDTIVACERGTDTVHLVVLRRQKAAAAGWQPAKHFHHITDGQGWLIGVAPKKTTGGTVTLRDGRKVPVLLSDGWYAASWTAEAHDERDRPLRIELTVDGRKWTVPAAG